MFQETSSPKPYMKMDGGFGGRRGGLADDRSTGTVETDSEVSTPALTKKDMADLQFGLRQGVDMVALEKVPGIQKSISAKARASGKFVITVTQMLESMVNSEVPTRAEVSDVANVIEDGTDAVMLSAESSTGRSAVEAVRMMARMAALILNRSPPIAGLPERISPLPWDLHWTHSLGKTS